MKTIPFLGIAEPLSSLSHLLAAGVFALLAVPLLGRAKRDPARLAAVGVYCFSVVTLLAISGLYHWFPRGSTARGVFQRLDHAAIFLLIAGTFTPPHVLLFRGAWRWGPLLGIWAAAVVGVVLKSVFFYQLSAPWGTLLYIGLGWMGLIGGLRLVVLYGWSLVEPLFWGAVAYTAGALLELEQSLVIIPGVLGAHELFHLAVLVGVALHWRFISSIVETEAEKCCKGPAACDTMAP